MILKMPKKSRDTPLVKANILRVEKTQKIEASVSINVVSVHLWI